MVRTEVAQLMQDIKVWYPRFEFPPDRLNAWFEKLQYHNYTEVKKALDRYVLEDEVGRTPTIAQLLKSKVSTDGVWIDYETRKSLQLTKIDEDTYKDQEERLWAYSE